MENILEQEKPKLELRFDPSTIEDLGIKMYSRLPYALAELIANAYDAAAEKVVIDFYDNKDGKTIVVFDDGDGMSYDEIQDKFLVIGRKRRKTDPQRQNSKRRMITGKKGLGKLALFGIGEKIIISSARIESENITEFTLDWNEILKSSGVYNPSTSVTLKESADYHGTKIVLTNLTRSSGFDLLGIANTISRMFNCYGNDFRVFLRLNGDEETDIEITRELRYFGLKTEFEWDISELVNKLESDYKYKKNITGKIFAMKSTTKAGLRGVCLYSNGRLVNAPSFFGLPEAEYAYSYISGWIDADYLDEFEDDLMSTDRQSLNWDMKEAEDLQEFLQKIIKYVANDWNKKRKKRKKKAQEKITGVDVEEWKNTLDKDIGDSLAKTIDTIADIESLDDDSFSSVIKGLHKLLPNYAQYHFRSLHPEIKRVSFDEYKAGNYYTAISEACKAYHNYVGKKASEKDPGFDQKTIVGKSRFGNVFGSKPEKILKVVSMIKKKNGDSFNADTINDLEETQMLLSQGIYTGFRNPISHENVVDLRESAVITEQNCLDALSLLSMLFQRVDNIK